VAHSRNRPADTLEELESVGQRIAAWVAANSLAVLATAGAILAAAAAVGGWQAWSASRAERASAEVAAAWDELARGMGGLPGDIDLPEPANPETAQRLRTEYAGRFAEIASKHEATAAGALAALHAGDLQVALGAPEKARALFEAAAEALPGAHPIRAVLEARIAHRLEEEGRPADAARAYERAAAVDGYPLRPQALASAARCWLDAGEPETGRAVYDRLRSESPDVRLPPHVEARLAEIPPAP
jgi:tetratricopeptide (TPR) repeat protein